MNKTNIYNQFLKVDEIYIDILRKVGILFKIDSEQEMILKCADEINYSQAWNSTIQTLDDIQIIDIFKGIVIVEKHFQWNGGSTASGIWFYREICERKIDKDLKLGNWAFLYTDNYYVPFGSNGNIRAQSKDAYDYVRNSQCQHSLSLTSETIDKINSYSSYLDLRIIDEQNVENTNLKRRITDLSKYIMKINAEKENLKLRLTLSKKSNIEKAYYIIENETRNIYFFKDEIEQIIADKDMPIELLSCIKNKFNDSVNKHNRDLKNRLINEMNNR